MLKLASLEDWSTGYLLRRPPESAICMEVHIAPSVTEFEATAAERDAEVIVTVNWSLLAATGSDGGYHALLRNVASVRKYCHIATTTVMQRTALAGITFFPRSPFWHPSIDHNEQLDEGNWKAANPVHT